MRQTLNAGNIANVNTPGSCAADLGNSRILETLLHLSPLPCVDDNLIKGLLAYGRGISEAAKTRLAEIDSRSLAPRSAAHLALAQAMLIACRRQVDGPLAGAPEVSAEQGKQVEFGLTDQIPVRPEQ